MVHGTEQLGRLSFLVGEASRKQEAGGKEARRQGGKEARRQGGKAEAVNKEIYDKG